MVDNVNITPGTGAIVSADEVTRTVAGEKMQIIKIGLGTDGAVDNLVAAGEQAESSSVPVAPSVDAGTFETMVTVAFGSVTGTFAAALTPTGALTELEINNDTNQPLVISFDAGTTEHWYIPLKEARIFTFKLNGRSVSSAIDIKHTGVAPTEGNVYLMAHK